MIPMTPKEAAAKFVSEVVACFKAGIGASDKAYLARSVERLIEERDALHEKEIAKLRRDFGAMATVAMAGLNRR